MKPSAGSSRSIPCILLLFALALPSVTGCGAQRSRSVAAAGGAPTAQSETVNSSASPAALSASDDRLYGVLWMKIASEYRALCLQAFQAGLSEVRRQAEHAPRVDGAPVGASGRPLAVVADLDETILDNWGYQKALVLSGTDYSTESWEQWVRQIDGVRLVPGAGEFIKSVESLGVAVVFISNRPDSLRDYTIRTLRRLGIETTGLSDPEERRLLLRSTTSDKERRRQTVLERFEVILYAGDNRGDFPESPGQNLGGPPQAVGRFDPIWGKRWIVLPNPVYGDWTRPLRGKDPRKYLEELR